MIISIDDFLKLDLKDEVFIIETDTVYGMGCLYKSEVGAKRILEIKNRSNEKFFSLLVSNLDQVSKLTKSYEESLDIMNEYWPGALTIIFNKSDEVGQYISPLDTVGLRMPDNDKTIKVLEKFGPMIMTSVNKSGDPAITKFNDCLKFDGLVDYIIKGEDLNGMPSTVYDAVNNKVLRQGSVLINKE